MRISLAGGTSGASGASVSCGVIGRPPGAPPAYRPGPPRRKWRRRPQPREKPWEWGGDLLPRSRLPCLPVRRRGPDARRHGRRLVLAEVAAQADFLLGYPAQRLAEDLS